MVDLANVLTEDNTYAWGTRSRVCAGESCVNDHPTKINVSRITLDSDCVQTYLYRLPLCLDV